MTGEDLAKVVEQVVLKVIEKNPVAILVALNIALDGNGPDAVLLVNRIKMLVQTPALEEVSVNSADAQITQFTKALNNCLTGTKSNFIDLLIESGMATEDYVDDKVETYVEKQMGEYPDEDTVRDMINSAWSGA